MLQSDFKPVFSVLFSLGLVLIIISIILLFVVEFNASPHKKEKQITRILEAHFSLLEAVIQISFTAGLFLICLSPTLISDDIVISIDLIILPFYFTPMFILGIHRRMRHFLDLVEERIIGLPEETFESLEPTMYARITLVYWSGSLLALLCYFAFRNSGAYPIIASVLLHYGVMGLILFTSPLLFSLGSLRRKSA